MVSAPAESSCAQHGEWYGAAYAAQDSAPECAADGTPDEALCGAPHGTTLAIPCVARYDGTMCRTILSPARR